MGHGRGSSENKATKFRGLWETQVAEYRPHLHPWRDKAQCCHAWHPASVKKVELCEKPHLKEVGSMGVVHKEGAGVTKARDRATGGGRNGLQRQDRFRREGRGPKRGSQDAGQGRALRTLG